MPTTEQLRSKLLNKLKELFQLNQPDLDFGFYRIMHAKSEQVSSFIENDLLQVIQATFGQVDETKKDKLKQELDNAIQTAIDFGAPDPEATPKVIEARAKYDAIKDSASSEAEIYDHLYRFFERYYDDGDFISRRYYTRETPGKAAPFSIPYNGEEVKLHWANADQYYIKTTEYFANYTVNLSEAIRGLKESKKRNDEEIDLEDSSVPEGLKLHFRIIDATEGDHANVKASDATKRYFAIHKEKPIELNDKNELVINFEYKPTTDKARQDTLNQEAVALVINALKDFEPRNARKDTKMESEEEPQNTQKLAEALSEEELQNPVTNNNTSLQNDLSCAFVPFVVKDYLSVLSTLIPTDKDKDRILLTKYINQYTARNTMDYFIHKNLGAFLKRELDFYIKNEIMRLDDIENAEIPKVEDYLSKIKVLRKIAIKLIEFMAQLEDFQKKLWLKKKFVVETNYCITLDRVPEELYPRIIENKEQIDEWIKLFAIDEIEADTTCPAFTNPLTLNFLKVNDKLLVDTRFFDDSFKARLISSIQDFDDKCDGLLIHSENFQALNAIQDRYRGQVNCVHIDPPYNTATSGFLYKNEYQHSSWMSLMSQGVLLAISLMKSNGVFQCHIDENEYERLSSLMDDLGLPSNGTIIWDKKNPMLGKKGIASQHEYVLWRSNNEGPVYMQNKSIMRILSKAAVIIDKFGGVNDQSRSAFAKWISTQPDLTGGEKAYKFLDNEGRIYTSVAMGAPEQRKDPKFFIPLIHPVTKQPCPVPTYGWSRAPETMQELIKIDEIIWGNDHNTQPRKKVYLSEESKRQLSSVIQNTKRGKENLDELGFEFPYCHPVSLYKELFAALETENSGIFIDYFAGSGTSGHAVITLNREDDGTRKYILVEMGDYFDTVLKPRIQKVVYSEKWKDGKPVAKDEPRKSRKDTKNDLQEEISCAFEPFVVDKFGGISHCFKYLRLESYEDTLNNLVLQNEPIRDKTIAGNASLKEDYLLHYMLDVESKGSQSLLNIDAFNDPTSYLLKVKKPGSDEYIEKAVDLIETFNYLIGLRLVHLGIPQSLTAAFTRLPDPDLPQDQDTKLVINGDFKQVPDGKWWIRKVEGWVPKNPYSPNDGLREKVLIVWRKLTGNFEEDNLILDSWFQKNRISTLDWEFDTIYVNGSNNLPNLQKDGDTWKVRLIEEEFMKRMWEQ
ncbi:MAG TPA: DNA methyltransferase [Candidatus Cloacimonadota bacterium]|nr:DNA methyltransferase [Candidatus Cloacimonadota bacterium]